MGSAAGTTSISAAPLPPIVHRGPDGRIELIPRQRAPQLPSKKVSVASGSNVSGSGVEALLNGSLQAAAQNQRASHRIPGSSMNTSGPNSGRGATAITTPPQAAVSANAAAAEELLSVGPVQEENGDGFERLERKSSAADSTVTTAIARAYGRKRSRSRSQNKSSSPDRSRDPSHPTTSLNASKSNRVGTGAGTGPVTGPITRSLTPATLTPKRTSSTTTPTHLVPKVKQLNGALFYNQNLYQ